MSGQAFQPTDDPINDLLELMRRLRDPDTGCPWDLEQDYASIAPYTIEEAYEVADAIERNNLDDLKEELGDLFLQVVFHSQIAQDSGHFSIQDVARSIVEKMVRRHPHVFGDTQIENAASQTTAWEAMKAQERARKSNADKQRASALDGVAVTLPALTRSEKLMKRAARTGFDWPTPDSIVEKLQEELDEVRQAAEGSDPDHLEEEIGDVLIVAANLSRKYGINPEQALRKANLKFERRFRAMEALAQTDGQAFDSLQLDAQEALWQRVKSEEG